MEQFPTIMLLMFVSGIYFPFLSGLFGLWYLVGRCILTWAYAKKGPNKRWWGSIFVETGLLALFGLAVASLVEHHSDRMDA